MRIIKIKNVQDQSDIYLGHTIGSGEYYTISTEAEREKFAVSDKVNQHLWSDPVKIKVSNGAEDLDSEKGDKWLKKSRS